MQIFGKTLVMFVFLAGAFIASLDPLTINWIFFVPVVLVGVLGIILFKRAEAVAAKDSTVLKENRAELEASLDRIVANLRELNGRKDKVPTYAMRFEIDKIFRTDLMNFADARESMKHIFGLRAYADIMSSFAAGERYINRVWSASTDGYVDEVLVYVEKAYNQFIHAKEEFEKAAAKTT